MTDPPGWTPGRYQAIARAIPLAAHEPAAVELVVQFLEDDIYAFGSGYLKADAIRFLTRSTVLDERAKGRLRLVVLAVVGGPDRREFRAYVRLARSVDEPTFRAQLEALSGSAEPRTARH